MKRRERETEYMQLALQLNAATTIDNDGCDMQTQKQETKNAAQLSLKFKLQITTKRKNFYWIREKNGIFFFAGALICDGITF